MGKFEVTVSIKTYFEVFLYTNRHFEVVILCRINFSIDFFFIYVEIYVYVYSFDCFLVDIERSYEVFVIKRDALYHLSLLKKYLKLSSLRRGRL